MVPVLSAMGQYRWSALGVAPDPEAGVKLVVWCIDEHRQERGRRVACGSLQELRERPGGDDQDWRLPAPFYVGEVVAGNPVPLRDCSIILGRFCGPLNVS